MIRLRILAWLGLVALALTPAGAQEKAPTAGRSIASLAQVALKSREGASITLGSRIAPEKPTLIAFWASWCAPCYGEARFLAGLRAELGDRFNFLYVNRREGEPDRDQPPGAIARILAYGGMTDIDYLVADVPAFRAILGPDMATIPQGLVGIPRVYLFGRDGRQVYAAYGYDPEEAPKLSRALKRALAK